MPDIKDMEGPVKFKKGVELYFDPKKDMFYDPKKNKYVSEKDILALEEVDLFEKSEEYQKFFQSALKKFGIDSPAELETIEEGVYDPSIFKAIFMAGGPGSGKSYVSNKVTAGLGMKVVNSDDIFEIFLKKAGMTTTAKDIFSDKGQEIRGNAKNVTSKRMELYLEGRLGLLIDGTGKDYNNIKKKADRLRDLGYDTYMVFVNTSLETAQERNANRPRKLDPKVVEKMWRSVQENIGKFQKYFGARNMIIVDNNSADEKYLIDVYKQVKKLIQKPVQNRLAKDWISKALDDKVRNEEVELLEKSEEYQKFFQSALKKFGVDSPAELDDKKKKEFFDYVDKNWEGENEEDEEETIEEKDMEEIEESRIRLSSLMNGGALLYDRDEDPDDDKLATVKVKGNPKKDIKNGDDLVLSLMDKGKSKEKEILKSLKKYYPKSKVVKEERIQEMFDLGDKVKRKDGSEEGEVVQRKTEDKSVGGRYKLKLKNGSRSKWINGNSLELVEQFSNKMKKYVDACGKDFTTYSLKEGKKDYEIYHKTFTSAVEEVEKFAEKNGYEIDSDEMFNKVGTGPKKPSVGKTNEYHLTLMKNGKEDRKKLHFQVHGMKTQYELNMYIS